MIGKLLGTAIKVVTLPVDVAEATVDVLVGGDGSKRSRRHGDINIVSEVRDGIVEAVEEIDN